jgi:hypothetical protein
VTSTSARPIAPRRGESIGPKMGPRIGRPLIRLPRPSMFLVSSAIHQVSYLLNNEKRRICLHIIRFVV